MIRLTLLLCAGLFAVMLLGGEDRGQMRFGLVAKPSVAEPVIVAAAEAAPVVIQSRGAVAKVSNAAFVPEKPVMINAAAAQDIDAQDAVVQERVMTVTAKSVNVRGGPGKDYSVMGRLTRGESVLVLIDQTLPEGWSHIRVEGDGIDGYIATRLLTE